MTLDVRTDTINIQRQEQPADTVAANNSSIPNAVIEGKGSENIDTVHTTSSAENTKISAKRTTEELYNKLFGLKQQYNLSNSDIKDIFEKVSGLPEEALINAEESAINHIINIVNNAVDILKLKKNDINATTIIDMSKNIKIRIDNDWTIEGAVKDIKQNKSQESLADKLRRVWPEIFTADFDFSAPENKEITKEKIVEYVKLFHKNEKLGNQDWAKMLANSKDDNERDDFDEILGEIDTNYRAKFIKSWLYSYESDINRAEAGKRAGGRIIELTQDMSETDTHDTAFYIRKVQNQDGVVATDNILFDKANKFFEENNIAGILEKYKNNEELTPEEKALLTEWQSHYQAVIEGSTAGTVTNSNISDEFKAEHLQNFVNPQIYAYGENAYRDILDGISEVFENHNNEFNMNSEEFVQIMDKATNGNYSTVIKDSQDGTKTELNAPSASENKSDSTEGQTAASEAALGYKNKETVSQENFDRINAKKEEIANNSSQNNNDNNTVNTAAERNNQNKNDDSTTVSNQKIAFQNSAKSGLKALIGFASENNISAMLLASMIFDIFDNVSYQIKDHAINFFKNLTNKEQELFYTKYLHNVKGQIAAARCMEIAPLTKVAKNLSNAYAQNAIEDIIEEKEKFEAKPCSNKELMA